MTDLLADEVLDTIVIKINDLLLNHFRITLLYLSYNLSTCKFLDKEGSTLCSILNNKRICATLITERSVCLKGMSLRTLSDRNRVEICALEEHVSSSFCYSRLLTAEYSCKTHRLLGISDHEVCCAESTLNSVKSNELLAFLRSADYYLATSDLRCIKCMKRLADLMKNEVGDINDIVDRTKTYCKELLLKPLRGCCYLYSLDGCSCITRSSISCEDLYRNRLSFALCKCRNIRNIEFAWNIIMLEVGIQVAGNTDMRSGIHAVCGETDLDDCICCESEIILCRCSHHSLRIKYHDTVM